ncbi:hypothetical protein LTR64_006632 [Lithohypha guttulata]|uniref:Major facilitator superfamily (MFS) profile domain-containing protein n=1 Tax=Lithohypha guttulata TaxID=1690604 RepID=A0AAN7T6Q3_9EURO|nr:hypothetical protein LTR51_004808 [Lithohypha guttulata]KAK5091419.1 hypothetical protein LTR05_001602 [Lithohypha guttulata]
MAEEKSMFHALSRVGSTENSHPAVSVSSTPSIRSLGNASSSTLYHDHADPEKNADITQHGLPDSVAKDVNLVDWNGPDDPEKPLNWSKRKKWTNVLIIGFLTLLTPFGSSMFAPGVPDMMEDFHSTNVTLASFVVSVYVLGYACGPLVIAPMSELYGRVPVYNICTFWFLVWTVLCGISVNMPMIIVMRFLAGLFGSCPITIGSGTIADCFRQEERGKVISAWTLPILFGPALGPIVGGYLSEYVGWRWNFHLLAIWTAVMFVLCLFLLPETYPPVLLKRKAQKLRKETGNQELRAPSELTGKTPSQLLLLNIIRPTKMLVRSPIVFLLSLFIAVIYGYLYIMFSTLTVVFEGQYNIGGGNVGLTFLGLGLGQIVGLLLFASTSDRYLKKQAAANGGVMTPEMRLPFLVYTSGFAPIGLFLYGWSAEYKVHWIVPILGTMLISIGMITAFLPVGSYLVDAFTAYAASAMAANTVLRSLGGALLPLAGREMYNKLGYGWGNSVLAFIALAFIPLVWLLQKHAGMLRTHPRFQLQL